MGLQQSSHFRRLKENRNMRQILRHLQKLPGWDYLPGRVKALAIAVANPALYPRHVQVEVTKRCNLQCMVCAAASIGREKAPDLTLDAFKSLIDQIPSTEVVTINGVGESFLNGDFLDMIEYARSKNIETRFITNMTRVTPEAAERLVKAGNGEVIASIDTTDPEMFADIRRGAKLETVFNNIRSINEAKKKFGSDKPEVKVHAVLLNRTLPTIPQMVQDLKNLGIKHLTFVDFNVSGVNLDRQFRDGGRMYDECLLNNMSEQEIWQEIEKIKALADDSFTIVTPGEYGGLKGAAQAGTGVLTCSELWDSPFVTCDGFVTPCCWASHPSIFNLGNINEQPFEKIWFSDKYFKLRAQHVMNRHHTHCRQCQQLTLTIADPSKAKCKKKSPRRYTKPFLFK